MRNMDVYQRLHNCIDNKIPAALVTVTEVHGSSQSAIGVKLLCTPDDSWSTAHSADDSLTEILEDEARAMMAEKSSATRSRVWCPKDAETMVELELYTEVFLPPSRLIVAGAGHVAKPVVHLGKMIGMDVTVICDRENHATKEQFPDADNVICRDYIDYFKEVPVDQETYILLLTRGHQYDVMILRELLGRDMGYVGMIGSKRRISGVFSQLAVEFDEGAFQNIYAPVGLDIGAQTPEEIAVSVIAEVLKKKNGASGHSLSEEIPYFILHKKE